MAEFRTFDLGQVIQTAEAIKGMRRHSATEALRDQYMGEQIQGMKAERERRTNLDAMNFGKERAAKEYARAGYILQAEDPKGLIESQYPDIQEMLTKGGHDWATMTPDQLRQTAKMIQAKAGAEAGIGPAAPAGPMSTQGKVSADVRGGFLTKEQGDAAINPGMSPYQKESLNIQRQRLAQGGGAAAPTVVTLSPEEIAAEGLPKGTIAQRAANGKISILKKPDAAGGGVKLTEGDKRARVMYASVLNAEKDIAAMPAGGADTSSAYNAAVGSNAFTRGMQTDQFRKYEAAGLRWAANLLYLKSGATAPPEEVQSTWKQFFPQFGDGDDVKAQKAQSRIEEITAVADAWGLDKSKIPQPKQPYQQPRGTIDRSNAVAPPTQQMTQQAPSQPPQQQGIDERGYASLPSGTQYRAPDGSIRMKR